MVSSKFLSVQDLFYLFLRNRQPLRDFFPSSSFIRQMKNLFCQPYSLFYPLLYSLLYSLLYPLFYPLFYPLLYSLP